MKNYYALLGTHILIDRSTLLRLLQHHEQAGTLDDSDIAAMKRIFYQPEQKRLYDEELRLAHPELFMLAQKTLAYEQKKAANAKTLAQLEQLKYEQQSTLPIPMRWIKIFLWLSVLGLPIYYLHHYGLPDWHNNHHNVPTKGTLPTINFQEQASHIISSTFADELIALSGTHDYIHASYNAQEGLLLYTSTNNPTINAIRNQTVNNQASRILALKKIAPSFVSWIQWWQNGVVINKLVYTKQANGNWKKTHEIPFGNIQAIYGNHLLGVNIDNRDGNDIYLYFYFLPNGKASTQRVMINSYIESAILSQDGRYILLLGVAGWADFLAYTQLDSQGAIIGIKDYTKTKTDNSLNAAIGEARILKLTLNAYFFDHTLATIDNSGELNFYELPSGRHQGKALLSLYKSWRPTFSQNGRYLWYASDNKSIMAYDLKTHQNIKIADHPHTIKDRLQPIALGDQALWLHGKTTQSSGVYQVNSNE